MGKSVADAINESANWNRLVPPLIGSDRNLPIGNASQVTIWQHSSLSNFRSPEMDTFITLTSEAFLDLRGPHKDRHHQNGQCSKLLILIDKFWRNSFVCCLEIRDMFEDKRIIYSYLPLNMLIHTANAKFKFFKRWGESSAYKVW